jgi:hypothetical protein
MSDFKLISLSLTAEFMSIDSENDLFRNLHESFLLKTERSFYTRRRRKLFEHTNSIRLKLVFFFNDFENYLVIDSMPLKV